MTGEPPPVSPGERATPDPGQAQPARALLDDWLADRDPLLLGRALEWAVALGDWTAIDAAWLNDLRRHGVDQDPDVVALLAALPPQARRANPMLTWAWAAAGSHGAPASKRETISITRLLSDAVSLHPRWREADTVDAAVAAGSIWMLAQRFMPSSPPSAALDAAWQIQNEVDDYIARQRRRLDPPSPVVEVTFRAASARVALARLDLRNVTAEADFALALDSELAGPLVRGGKNLALELMGFPSDPVEPPDTAEGSPSFGVGLTAQDSVSEQLARALSALRRLDRAGCQEVLARFAAMPPGAPGWTGVVFVHEMVGALWGDAEATLTRADAAFARHAVVSLEHRGVLGGILLARGRIVLLNRLGSHQAAHEVQQWIPAGWRRTTQALILVWSGDLEGAKRTANAGLHDATTVLFDRLVLLAVRASALALDPGAPPDARNAAAAEAVGACVENEVWLPLALVPSDARHQVLQSAAAGGQPDDSLRLLAERLDGLSADPRRPGAPISLSRREQVLLPLLATTQTVPEIAGALHVSANTVRKQVVTLRSKFGAGSRQELVRRARDAGLL